MDLPWRLKFGVFMAPYHPVGESPSVAIDRDVKTLQLLDDLQYDEAWIGEHHSGGWEPISSPELFIAHVAQVTRSIRLGTGVISLPYHNPYFVAERMTLLDHLTRGRIMLGVGPGATPPDTAQLGLTAPQLRPRLDEGVGVIQRLLAGEEVTQESDWFKLHRATVQLRPYQDPCFPIAIATGSSPAGATIAGKYGVGILSGASFRPLGDGLGNTWEMAEEAAAKHGKTMDRRNWRVMTRVYVAETREQAWANLWPRVYQFDKDYFNGTLGRPFTYDGRPEDYVEWCCKNGSFIAGSPEDVIEGLQRVWEASRGGFGGVLLLAHEWATSQEKIWRHYELFARYVAPHFQGTIERFARAHRWTVDNREAFNAGEAQAIAAALEAVGAKAPEVILGARVRG